MECNSCGEEIPASRDHYECRKCSGFFLCSACFEEEDASSRHTHALHRVKGRLVATALFAHTDRTTNHRVVLTNCAGVLPASPLFSGGVRAVLSLLDLSPPNDDDDSEDDSTGRLQPEQLALADYAYAGGTVQSSVRHGVVYHCCPLEDVSDPRMLRDTLDATAAESCAFISHALERGVDVAVHCYLGLRRSPTMLAAWMVTQHGTTVDAALAAIGAGHAEAQQWDAEFRRLRPGWVEWLHRWRTTWRVAMDAWKEENSAEIDEWNRMFDQASAPTPSVNPKDGSSEEEEYATSSKRKVMRPTGKRALRIVDDEDDVATAAAAPQQPESKRQKPVLTVASSTGSKQTSIVSFFRSTKR